MDRPLLPWLTFALLALALPACLATTTETAEPAPSEPAPPIAKRVPHELSAHGHTRVDPYYWMRERDDPEVLAYLEAENVYTEAVMADAAPLRVELFAELIGRIVQDDSTVPVRDRDYFYYARWVEGGEHPTYYRKRGSVDAPDELVLDVAALAEGHEFYAIGDFEISEGQQLVAYAADTVGRRFYTIRIRDLETGEALADTIPDTAGEVEWAADDRTLLYVVQDPQTLREHKVMRHTLGDDPADDALVYAETDPTYSLGLWRTQSRAYLVIDAGSTLSDEVRVIDARAPTADPQIITPRERGLEYDIDHLGGHFYVRTNLDAGNFRLMKTPVAKPGKASWREIVGHRDDVLLESFLLFDDHLVLEQRRRGLIELSVRGLDGREDHVIDFGEPTYVAYETGNLMQDTTTLRYAYESMTTPRSEYDYDMATRQKTLLKRQEVLGGFDSANYRSARLEAPTRDGVRVPISLVARVGDDGEIPRAGDRPLLLYAYGSYGASMDAEFSASVLSLLDRGFVYAIAHVRGGEELGRSWYEDGKLLAKTNSFTDFIDCAEFLVAQGYADPDRVFAEGGSAGGLLIGAVVNMRPDLFAGALAGVPFVDVVTTMLDDTIPLTTSEYDEWGDPNDPVYYEYMLSYSPYDNVVAQDYPALLVTTGLHDSQVQYWEPAKWVAKLRATKTDHNLLLLRTDMSAGHGGKSGRLAKYEDTAFEFAFLLRLAGLL